ncbi:MAG: phosphatase PAP2 family protein [Planctomycetes bacterium]|nr:phosphatase PAP2 family protein [Planctomycetota bacterium]
MRERLYLSDWAIVGYCVVVSLLCVARMQTLVYVPAHLAVAGIVLTWSRFDRSGVVGFCRSWDAVALVPALFFMAMQIVHRVHPVDYDDVLMRIDRAIGGVALLRAMVIIERPWLTDLMKLAWIGYYFLPLLVLVPLYRLGPREFDRAKGALVLGFTASYLCYFALPAVGPGYHQEVLGVPQPKWEATAVSAQAKGLIHALEAKDPRHTFPSGHVMVAAMVAYYLLRHRLRAWAVAGVPIAAAIIASTIYLRYHYLVDVLAGLALAGACVLIARRAVPRIPPLE